MPEGPTIIIVKETISPFIGNKIIAAKGYADIDFSLLEQKKITSIQTWGKHLFICLKDINIEIHFRMFGSYLINDRKPKTNAKLSLQFAKEELNFYVVDVKLIKDISIYDNEADVMSEEWNTAKAIKKLKGIPNAKICDALLDQQIFSGVGNIIKNEALWLVKLHPETLIKNISAFKFKNLMKEVVDYSFEFLQYKKAGTLSKHWKAYNQKTCSRCKHKIIKLYIGKGKRATYICENCQRLKR